MNFQFPYFVLPGAWPPTSPHIFIRCLVCDVELPTTWDSQDLRCECGNLEIHERGVEVEHLDRFQCFSDIDLKEGHKPRRGEYYQGKIYWGD